MTAEVVVYLPDLSGGGAERLFVHLVPSLAAMGYRPRFLLDQRRGELLDIIPFEIPISVLGARRSIAALPKLIRYLRTRRPDVLIVNMEHMAVMTVLARCISRVSTRIIVVQHNALSEQMRRPSWKWRKLASFYRPTLRRADAIVAVSRGVATDLVETLGNLGQEVRVIHNGVVSKNKNSSAPRPDHPWFDDQKTIVLGMGRLVFQKDFETLLNAFAQLPDVATRLIILGEGPLRSELEQLARDLGLSQRVAFPGFVADPLPWLTHARLFVLSSRFEGFGNVLVEALACGTPVVSTDCPHGPAEILAGGRFGRLVPVGDAASLSVAITDELDRRPDKVELRARGNEFSVEACAAHYHAVISDVSGNSMRRHLRA